MLYEFIGFIGMGLLLMAFIRNEIGNWSSESIPYDLTNFIGAGMLTVYAYFINSYPFLLLNGVWSLVALRDLIIHFKKNKNKKKK